MKAIWIILSMTAVWALSASPSALAQSAQTFLFTCEIDLNQLRPADIARSIPANQVGKIFLETGEKKCTFSKNPNIQIKCEKVVDDWPNPRNVTIKVFNEACQWFRDECGTEGTVQAEKQQLDIQRIDADTALLRLFCQAKTP